MGHEAQFPSPKPDARYRFGQGTCARSHLGDKIAPKAVTPAPPLFQNANPFFHRFPLRSVPVSP
jgi:hypothetical protein